MKCRLHIFTKNCSCLHEHCSLLFTCQQIIVRVRKQYIQFVHSCRERALINSSASSNNYLIDVQLKCPFLLMSIRLISPAFNIHTVCIYILPTGKLLNGDSKCWTASRLHDQTLNFLPFIEASPVLFVIICVGIQN